MKTIVISILFILVSVGLCADGVLPIGAGTETDPYQIASLDNLLYLSTNNYLWEEDTYFVQTADIDAGDTQNWNDGDHDDNPETPEEPMGFIPIGVIYYNYFAGNYNGQGYAIDSLYIYRPTDRFIGLFGYTNGAEISNLGVTNTNIEGYHNVGGLAGIGDYYITNCFSTGFITGHYDSVGGLVGGFFGEMSNCYSDANVLGIEDSTGGLIGRLGGNVISSYSTGDVTGVLEVGGLAGKSEAYCIITNCFSTSNVYGQGIVGGLVGLNFHSDINNCYSTGNVMDIPPTTSYNNICGGLVGRNYQYSEINNSYSIGDVSGRLRIGGLVGDNYNSLVNNCYSIGFVSGTDDVGGLIGILRQNSEVYNSFWDIDTSGQSTSNGGTGKTSYEMQSVVTFTSSGWDFAWEIENGSDDIWGINGNDNEGYPFFIWQDFQSQTSSPQNISILETETNIVLSWDEVYGAISYKVFSSEIPNSGFTEDTSGFLNGETWSAPLQSSKRFYHVKAVN
jgi:hypothetical protein